MINVLDPEGVVELLGDQTLDVYFNEKITGTYSICMKRVPHRDAIPMLHIRTEYAVQIGEIKRRILHEGIVSGKLETICQKSAEFEAVTFHPICAECVCC